MHGYSGKYRLDQRLGGGGMAEVFLGSSMGAEGFSRRVAIKRVLPGYSDNEAFAQMFVSEAQISSLLVHPNIVSVLDFDRDAERRLFLVMELVDGKDLDGLMATGVLPIPVVIYVIGEVLRGLGYAHDLPTSTGLRGVVHRDISPHNVLLSWEGAVKVSDFGIAKARSASEATASVFIKGKPAYMSPEQANGEPLDGRSDLFAVGIMLWEMLCGRRLFVAEDMRATLAAVLFGQIPRPRSLRSDVPKDLERVVMKLLERDLKARYATAEQALADLLSCTDAPRAGRELLMATLVERFTNQAPVRQSLMGSRSGSTPVPQTSPGYVAAAPSLGAVMNAPTQTVTPIRPARGRTVAIAAVAITVAVGVLVLAIVLGTRKKTPALSPDAGSAIAAAGSDAAGASPAADAPEAPSPDTAPSTTAQPPDAQIQQVDAPPVPLDAPSHPVARDAGIVPPRDAPKKPAPDAEVRQPVTNKTGKLRVATGKKIMTVTVDGVLRDQSPITIELPVGPHHVHLENVEDPNDKIDRTVEIIDNQTKSIP